jgi:hypothetical protein
MGQWLAAIFEHFVWHIRQSASDADMPSVTQVANATIRSGPEWICPTQTVLPLCELFHRLPITGCGSRQIWEKSCVALREIKNTNNTDWRCDSKRNNQHILAWFPWCELRTDGTWELIRRWDAHYSACCMCHYPPRCLHIPSITTSSVRRTRLVHGLHSRTSDCAGKSTAGMPEYVRPPHFLAMWRRRAGARRFIQEHIHRLSRRTGLARSWWWSAQEYSTGYTTRLKWTAIPCARSHTSWPIIWEQ